jgi:hypothetical protein
MRSFVESIYDKASEVPLSKCLRDRLEKFTPPPKFVDADLWSFEDIKHGTKHIDRTTNQLSQLEVFIRNQITLRSKFSGESLRELELSTIPYTTDRIRKILNSEEVDGVWHNKEHDEGWVSSRALHPRSLRGR